MTITVSESVALNVSEADSSKSGRLQVCLITPGWGSSGYYAAEVLESAASAGVFHAGTQMFLDHPSESEMVDRPERSVRDLAAVLTENAQWDGGALVSEVQVFGPYKDMLTDEAFAKSIGVSIRALAVGTAGEAEGRKGTIVQELVEAVSVDFVTQAGRGGQVLQVLESARDKVVHRAVAHGVQEATANDTREALQQALRDAYGADQSWVWVRDFDAETVWFELETPDEMATYAQAYTLGGDGTASLDGDRTEVRARTEYVPIVAGEAAADEVVAGAIDQLVASGASLEDATRVAAEAVRLATTVPADEAGRSTTTADPTTSPPAENGSTGTAAEAAHSSQEETMTHPTGAGASAPQNTPRQVLEGRITALTDQMAQMVARDRARDIIAEELAEAWVVPSAVARLSSELIADLPIVEHQLNEAALRDRCVAARDRAELEAAETLTAVGVGTPRGLGSLTRPANTADEATYDTAIAESLQDAFGLSESAAQTAVKGR